MRKLVKVGVVVAALALAAATAAYATSSRGAASDTFVFGASPKRFGQPQKILVAVSSWQCTSSPTTASNSVPACALAMPA